MIQPPVFEYSSILERISDGFIALDNDMRCIYANKRVRDRHGWDSDAIAGQSVWELFPYMLDTPMSAALERAAVTQQYTFILGLDQLFDLWVEYNIYPSADGFAIFMRNVTDKKKAEELLARERDLSESIMSSLPGVFYLYDETGRFIHWNENFETATGYTGDEISHMHPLDFFEGDEKTLLKAKIEEVFSQNISSVEAYFITKDQQRIPYYFTGRAITYDHKRCLIGVGIDISDRVHAEQEITRWESRFRHTLDHMLEGVQIFDADWRCVYMNESVLGHGLYTDVEARGRTLMENYPGIENTELFRIFQQCRQLSVSRHIEYQFEYPDGTTRWFELSIQPNPEGLFILSIDIDERKKADEALRRSEEQYRYLFNNNPASIMIWDLETLMMLEVNDKTCQLYGYTRDEFLTRSVLDHRPKGDRDKMRNFAKMMLTGSDQKFSGIWHHIKNNDGVMYMDITSHRIDYNGRPAILSMGTDVTERYHAQEELQRSYADIRRLNNHLETVREEERLTIAREIHDELGQQLTGLKMDVSWLTKRINASDPAILSRVADIMALLDETVKTVRRISSDLRPGILDDLGLMAALEWQSGEFHKRSGVRSLLQLPAQDLQLDKKKTIGIFRVYQEALTNITRHADATEVMTTMEQEGDDVVLTIRDNGRGFDREERRSAGTLGLIGMNERAIMLGGGLYIESEPGRGSTVVLRIPMDT